MASRLRVSFRPHLVSALLAIGGMTAAMPCFAASIPAVHGTSLANEAVNLPGALQGKVGVLVVGFSRGSREAVAGWGRRLAADYRDSPTVVYYEMPVLASVPGMLRGLVVRSMKSSVPQRAQARFVPITDKEAAWRNIAHYGQAEDAYLLVVDGQGDVAWQTQGQPTDAAYGALKQQVETLRTRTAR